jgi:hypothetical protein
VTVLLRSGAANRNATLENACVRSCQVAAVWTRVSTCIVAHCAVGRICIQVVVVRHLLPMMLLRCCHTLLFGLR